jgi:molybdate transport system regulatory protein
MNDRLEPRIRILLGSSIAIGPGKAALLEAIGETGSIAAAGRRMGMSYQRAWVIAKTMNECFREPLIAATKGDIGGGGARLTSMGREVLALYRAMEDHAAARVVSLCSRRAFWLVHYGRLSVPQQFSLQGDAFAGIALLGLLSLRSARFQRSPTK